MVSFIRLVREGKVRLSRKYTPPVVSALMKRLFTPSVLLFVFSAVMSTRVADPHPRCR